MGDTCDIKQVTFNSPSLNTHQVHYLSLYKSFLYKGPSAHPPEHTYPCCIPALGEFSAMSSRGGSGRNHSLYAINIAPANGRIRIAAECARLESVYRETYRGFKSLILRGNIINWVRNYTMQAALTITAPTWKSQ